MRIVRNTDFKETIWVEDEFSDNDNHWEEVDNEKEFTAVRYGHYVMENRAKCRWNYYAIRTPLTDKDDFQIESEIRLVDHKRLGHFGIIWGFDQEFKYVNRFTVSADGKRILIMFFERDHQPVLYRFQLKHEPLKSGLFKFRIEKKGPYYQFYLNEELINIVHEFHLPVSGGKAGFYIEPGLRVEANSFVMKQLL